METIQVIYAYFALHYFLVLAMALAIVGGYRRVAQCGRFSEQKDSMLGVFSTQPWPQSCLMHVSPAPPGSFQTCPARRFELAHAGFEAEALSLSPSLSLCLSVRPLSLSLPMSTAVQVGPTTGSFSNLSKFEPNSMTLMPTSCGYSGYIPDQPEWERNQDYFLKN